MARLAERIQAGRPQPGSFQMLQKDRTGRDRLLCGPYLSSPRLTGSEAAVP